MDPKEQHAARQRGCLCDSTAVDAVDDEALDRTRHGGKMPKDADEDGGGWGADGAGPPIALAYDSEEERMEALAPKTDTEIVMEQRKQKAQKMIEKKPGTTLNPRKVRYDYCSTHLFAVLSYSSLLEILCSYTK